ncbi:MAG TPA: glycosyltransferase [Methanothrix sp.]|nr:glycosyltransferase [Methanothrix sp.]HPT18465.1 glycosyltransferase [Methanothrix sp.]
MKVLLLANQPERTTRLLRFEGTLKGLGMEVVVPRFHTRNWISIARQAAKIAMKERPDVVHIFNVPDIIYHNFSRLRGEAYKKLIYDYRSPWGLELSQSFGIAGKAFGERFERELAVSADIITSVNKPLADKVKIFAPDREPHIIPNYPERSFSQVEDSDNAGLPAGLSLGDGSPVIFIGRICTQEGVGKLLSVAASLPDQEFWIVGDGPFARWLLRNKTANVRELGWQAHKDVARLVKAARICLIPREESVITPYSTDRSVWKLNEYLNMGKLVIASGVVREEPRKNLMIVKSEMLEETLKRHIDDLPQAMQENDYRYWDNNRDAIKKVYDEAMS